jgi:hypothetical protein
MSVPFQAAPFFGKKTAMDTQKNVESAEAALPAQVRAKLNPLRECLSKLLCTPQAQACAELESRNASRHRLYGDAVEDVRLCEGSAEQVYLALLRCLAADLAQGGFDIGVELVPILAAEDARAVEDAVRRLASRNERVATDPGLRAYYEKDLARRLHKHRDREGGARHRAASAIRKITVKVHFQGAFGPHDILRVGEDRYYLMRCSNHGLRTPPMS